MSREKGEPIFEKPFWLNIIHTQNHKIGTIPAEKMVLFCYHLAVGKASLVVPWVSSNPAQQNWGLENSRSYDDFSHFTPAQA